MYIKEPGSGGASYPGSFTRNKEYYEKFNYVTLMKSFLGNSSIILCDIGAHNGESTNWFAKHFDISVAYLFEPNPLLDIKVDKNIKNVFIYNVALSSENSYKEFFIHKTEGMSSIVKLNLHSKDSITYSQQAKVDSIEVKSQTLDSMGINKVDLVKIDVQAHELFVLQGGKKTLSDAKVILIEVNLYDLYSGSSTIGEVERLLPNHLLFSVPFISYNPKNFRTDWVELFFVNKKIVQSHF
jgi:FkbM family methyltransferase